MAENREIISKTKPPRHDRLLAILTIKIVVYYFVYFRQIHLSILFT